MDWFGLARIGLTVIGLLTVVLLLVGVVVFVVCCTAARAPKRLADEYALGRQDERNSLRQIAHWFAEDTPTMHLLIDLASGKTIGDARDNWRERRKESREGPH